MIVLRGREEMTILIRRLGITYREAAARLGLSLSGLNHQMRNTAGRHHVTRRTEMLLEQLERAARRWKHSASADKESR
jgi:DNA-binding CsgD family transcriptional regulator